MKMHLQSIDYGIHSLAKVGWILVGGLLAVFAWELFSRAVILVTRILNRNRSWTLHNRLLAIAQAEGYTGGLDEITGLRALFIEADGTQQVVSWDELQLRQASKSARLETYWVEVAGQKGGGDEVVMCLHSPWWKPQVFTDIRISGSWSILLHKHTGEECRMKISGVGSWTHQWDVLAFAGKYRSPAEYQLATIRRLVTDATRKSGSHAMIRWICENIELLTERFYEPTPNDVCELRTRMELEKRGIPVEGESAV